MSESVRAFERGLRVIRSFGAERPEMTLAEVARATELNRATARRLLLTLEGSGYVRRRGDHFALTPRVLELGYAYLSSFAVSELALPYLEELSRDTRESSSMGLLDGAQVVYVARVPANRVMTVSIGLGTRFPAYRTSLGRALMMHLPDDEVAALWEASDRSDPTPRTVRSLTELRRHLAKGRAQGWVLVDQELELGVRSIAAPVRDATGQVVAAANLSTHTSRTTRADVVERFVPKLVAATASLADVLARRG